MICLPAERRPHVAVPAFWSNQFGLNIKSVGVEQPTSAAPVPAGFPEPRAFHLEETVVLTGYDPNEKRVEWLPRRGAGAGARIAAAG
jgi:hypothetical protein